MTAGRMIEEGADGAAGLGGDVGKAGRVIGRNDDLDGDRQEPGTDRGEAPRRGKSVGRDLGHGALDLAQLRRRGDRPVSSCDNEANAAAPVRSVNLRRLRRARPDEILDIGERDDTTAVPDLRRRARPRRRGGFDVAPARRGIKRDDLLDAGDRRQQLELAAGLDGIGGGARHMPVDDRKDRPAGRRNGAVLAVSEAEHACLGVERVQPLRQILLVRDRELGDFPPAEPRPRHSADLGKRLKRAGFLDTDGLGHPQLEAVRRDGGLRQTENLIGRARRGSQILPAARLDRDRRSRVHVQFRADAETMPRRPTSAAAAASAPPFRTG